MPFPTDLQFSQSSLQDYLECPRRFELRYLKRLQWPAIKSEPVLEHERRILLGERFHHTVHQSILGVPPEMLEASLDEPELAAWWGHFVRSALVESLPEKRLPEKTVTAFWEGFHFIAKYDLLAIEPGKRAVIVDWKTSVKRQPSALLQNSVQSRLYPFLLVLAGGFLNDGQPVEPEQVEMIYWFANFPEQPEHFRYSEERYQADREFLRSVTGQIAQTPEGMFLLTDDVRKCRFCNYRSLCDRGEKAGSLAELAEEEDESGPDAGRGIDDIDFDQIGEIAF